MIFRLGDMVKLTATGDVGKVIQITPHDNMVTYVVESDGVPYVSDEENIKPILGTVHDEPQSVDVREAMEEPISPSRLPFILDQPADKNASIKRKVATEELLHKWHRDINDTNLRELPLELVTLYNLADRYITEIIDAETKIILGR